ncbi:response regulator [Rudanella paleaurantiibacter]|uniref:Response regulator n=1 Tax=Rudanella paleaurantiibacter TaxID=2614655 RepID=A0A7J5TUG5_9BACT|nr:response regulator [Rudanella paleaurantiibacter]KAB7727299.1 response regulator [Rudanella paleaurantiibacter]
MPQPIRCLIVDDEELAQDILEAHIARVPFLQLVHKASNAFDAIDFLNGHPVDIVFTDIEMPQLTGIEMVRSLQKIPYIIFTTAYPTYAIDGFNLSATDYLLKPIAFDRFLKAVNKVRDHMRPAPALAEPTDRPEPTPVAARPNFIFVRENAKVVQVFFADIIWVEGLRDYVKIITTSRTIITHATMKKMEELLPADEFVRVQRSYIARIAAIKAINGNLLEMVNGVQLQIGQQYRDALMEVIKPIN